MDDREPWTSTPRLLTPAALVDELLPKDRRPTGRAAVLAIDGRSASGKSTLARRLCGAVDGAVVVATDDIAWYHSFFDWATLLVDGVLSPAHAGRAVEYRPAAWDERGRVGAIAVSADCPLVIVEGVGAARHEVVDLVDAAVWVQSDRLVAERLGIARDGGEAVAREFWDEWIAAEEVFVTGQRPWARANLVVAGTGRTSHVPPGLVAVSGRPPLLGLDVESTTDVDPR